MTLLLHIYIAAVLTLTGHKIRTVETSLPPVWGSALLLIAALDVVAIISMYA